jgi:DNA-binding LacI/PurR family transcriptional regulator
MIEKGLYIDKNYIFKFTTDLESSYDFILKYFNDMQVEVSAFFCITNYFLGTGMVQAMLRLGIPVPERIAIAGVSNEIFNKHIHPHPASVSMDVMADAIEITKMIFEADKKQESYEEIKFSGKSRIITNPGETI